MNQNIAYRVQEFTHSTISWNEIKGRVFQLEKDTFGNAAASPTDLTEDFLNLTNIVVLLYDTDLLIGFTHAKPIEEPFPERISEKGETVIVWNTIIDPAYRGKRLVGDVMRYLENILRRKGYMYLERYAAVANRYAENIERVYKDRIIASEPFESELYGPQVFFRIRI